MSCRTRRLLRARRTGSSPLRQPAGCFLSLSHVSHGGARTTTTAKTRRSKRSNSNSTSRRPRRRETVDGSSSTPLSQSAKSRRTSFASPWTTSSTPVRWSTPRHSDRPARGSRRQVDRINHLVPPFQAVPITARPTSCSARAGRRPGSAGTQAAPRWTRPAPPASSASAIRACSLRTCPERPCALASKASIRRHRSTFKYTPSTPSRRWLPPE